MADFTQNIVNQRFRKIYYALETNHLIKGKSDIAKKLGTYNHVINSILKGQRNITVDQLAKLFDLYPIDANYVFGKAPDIFTADIMKIVGVPSFTVEHMKQTPRSNIILVKNKALAGYAIESADSEYLENLPKFSVPGIEGKHIAFEIDGDSMMPTITNGDVVICESLESGTSLRDNNVYVVVTDTVVAKRIQQIKNGDRISHLRLISDNHELYKPYEVELNEVREILKVKCRLTSHSIS